MRPALRRRCVGAVLLALALGACGPYAQLAQKLDVTARIAGDTWIAAVGPGKTELRMLLIARPDADGAAAFAFTSMQNPPLVAGPSVLTLQGTWTEVGAAGAATLHGAHTYVLKDESSVALLSRRGAWRDDTQYAIPITVSRDGGRLVVSGAASLAGTYVPFVPALAALGTATERGAACAFQIFNLAIQSSEARIIGFGGPGMTQYSHSETYVGTVAGSVRISLSGGLTGSTTTIAYSGFEDFGGVRVSGPQVTKVDSGGDGHMSGVMTFTIMPISVDPATATTITGTVDYGAIQISNGNASGGVYVSSIDGGGTAQVDGASSAVRFPAVADCLALP
jgi:hypothetical protein